MTDPNQIPGAEPPAATETAAPQAAPQQGGQPHAQAQAGDAAAPADASALAARVKELEGQQADLTDRLLRAHAEMENLRKRTEREKTETAKYAISKFANDIVGVSDNFQRAVGAVPGGDSATDGALKSLVEGVLMTERAFLQVLEKHGVRRIDPKGEPFDPNRHQAVMEEQNGEVPAGTVVKVFQVGYSIEDRVLRPAMVAVARGGAKPVKPAEAPKPANENSAGGTAGSGTAGA